MSQNSKENTCARASFVIKLQAWGLQLYFKTGSGTDVFLWNLRILKNIFFTEHFQSAASEQSFGFTDMMFWSSHQSCSLTIGVLKKSVKFTGKDMYQSLFLIKKTKTCTGVFSKKETLAKVFSEHLFYITAPVAATEGHLNERQYRYTNWPNITFLEVSNCWKHVFW